jgi:hypothetical protein
MKILFIYTKVDKTLNDRVDRLREHGAEVCLLSLLEYKLYKKDKDIAFDIETKLDFLEGKSKLQKVSRALKRKKLLSYLDDYDLIDIYKCESSALNLIDDIQSHCCYYFITPSDENLNPSFIKVPFFKDLYEGAEYVIFGNLNSLNSFKLASREKLKLVCEPVGLFEYIDRVTQEEILKATHAMGLELEKDIVYCDLASDIDRQLDLIDEIASLEHKKLRSTTFIFVLGMHDLDSREQIKSKLLELNFDYLLIEQMLNDKQKALIHKLCNKAIILEYSDKNPSLPISLYCKNIVYLYDEDSIDELFLTNDFFMKSFDEFKDEREPMEEKIENDLLKRNQKLSLEFFGSKESIQKYIELIKSL